MKTPSSSERSDTRRGIAARAGSPPVLAAAALCAITLAFYHGLWLPGQVLIKRDAFRVFLPLKDHMLERFAGGELPQWFPYEALGRPFIGATATGVFHPFTALHFLFPVPDAYRASTLICCLLAALGAYHLSQTLRVSWTGSLLASFAYSLSGFVVSLTDSIVYLYSLAVLPVFCAAIENALVGPRTWTVVPAAIWATVFLMGDVQTGYYYGFIALLWMSARASGSYRDVMLRLALTAGLAALLAGVQLGPSLAVFPSSERAHPVAFLEQAVQWSTHPLRLATILASPVAEQADPVVVGRVFFGNPLGGLWAESLYMGVPVVGLALLGAWQRRDLRMLAVLGGVGLVLALGRFGGLYELFFKVVPLWSAFRYPEKLMGIVSFATAMLAGAGCDALRARHGSVAPWFAIAMLCALTGLGLTTDAAVPWTAATFGASETLAREVAWSSGRAFLYSAVAAAGVGVFLTGLRKGYLRESAGLAALIALITLDLARANLGTYHTGPAEAAIFTPPLAEAIRQREGTLAPGRFRLISIHEDILVWPEELMRPLGFYGAGSVERRHALDFEHNAQFHLETVMPYLPGFSSQFAETLNPRTGIEAAARLNAKYYIGRRYHLKDPQLRQGLIAELPPYDLALFKNPVPAWPRAYLSRRPERAVAPVDPLALYTRPDFLNGDVDVIETTAVSLPGPARGGSAAIERYAPEEVQVHVETPQPAVLILLDAFDRGWTATLESGAGIPILRANVLVRAVVVPAGVHMVTFRYETPLLWAGAGASLTGCLLCLAMFALTRWGTRKSQSTP